MSLLKEGRKEDIFKRYEDQINAERKLNSSVKGTSFYDEIIKEPFMQQTNFKYLEPLMKQFYFWQDVPSVKGEDLDNLEPSPKFDAETTLTWMFDMIRSVIKRLNFLESNKERLPVEYRDINKYVGVNFDDFLDYLDVFSRKQSKKAAEKEIKKNTDVIYSGDNSYIVKPKSYESSCLYGANTRWCTASRDTRTHYQKYTQEGNLYYVILPNVDQNSRFKKVAIQTFFDSGFDNSVYWDTTDNTMSKEQEELFKYILGKNALNAIESDFEKSKLGVYDTYHENIVKFFEEKRTLYSVTDYLNFNVDSKVVRIALSLYALEYLSKSYDELYFNIYLEVKDEGTDESIIKTTYGISCQKINKNYYVTIISLGNEEFNEDVDLESVVSQISEFKFKMGVPNSPEIFVEKLFKNFHIMLVNSLSNNNNFISYLHKINDSEYNPAYTFAKYKFTRGGRLTKELISYLDKLGPNNPITKKKFLTDMGRIVQTDGGWTNRTGQQIQLSGYLSSFFSAAKQAGITKGTGHAFTQGPKFKEYKKKFDL